jgi:hypothetical protein
MTSIPIIEPEQITAGTTIKWKRSDLSEYPANVWTLTYVLVNASGQFTIEAVPDGDSFSVKVSAAESGGYAPGKYHWKSFVSNTGGERYPVDSGEMEVLPDFAALAAGYDARSMVQKTFDAIEAVINRQATKTQSEYQIGGRMLKRIPLSELMKLRDRYEVLAKQEQATAKRKAGKRTGRKILTRFVR